MTGRRDDGMCCAECVQPLHAEDGLATLCAECRAAAEDPIEDDAADESWDGTE